MSVAREAAQDGHAAGFRAVELLYHAFLTGLILTTVTRRGSRQAARLLYRTFRRQQREKFLPGIEKLGLRRLPDAVAAAQYHYLSNHLGGVRVQYMYESDRKAWIRYPPPRWIFDGTAICAVPSEVARAMLAGWHARNGISLRNPRLGFVCTGQTMDGQPGLEGYYLESDDDLEPDERLRFAPGEEGPGFDPRTAPRLPADSWPEIRRQKAKRNYAMDYVRSILCEIMALFGPAEGGHLASITASMIGMQYYDEARRVLGLEHDDGPEEFARFFERLGDAQGDEISWSREGGGVTIRQRGWRLLRGVDHVPRTVLDAWSELWAGALAVHNRRLSWESSRMAPGDEVFEWRIR